MFEQTSAQALIRCCHKISVLEWLWLFDEEKLPYGKFLRSSKAKLIFDQSATHGEAAFGRIWDERFDTPDYKVLDCCNLSTNREKGAAKMQITTFDQVDGVAPATC